MDQNQFQEFEQREKFTFIMSLIAIAISIVGFFITIYEKLSDSNLELKQYTFFHENNKFTDMVFILKNTGNMKATNINIYFDFARLSTDSGFQRTTELNILEYHDFHIPFFSEGVINKSENDINKELVETQKLGIESLFPGEIYIMKIAIHPRYDIIDPFIYYIKHTDGYKSFKPLSRELSKDELIQTFFTYENLLDPQIRDFITGELAGYKYHPFIINESKRFINEYSLKDFDFYIDLFTLLSKVGDVKELTYFFEKLIKLDGDHALSRLSEIIAPMIMEKKLSKDIIDLYITKCRQIIDNKKISEHVRKLTGSRLLSLFLQQENVSPEQEIFITNQIIDYLDSDENHPGDSYLINKVLTEFLQKSEDKALNNKLLEKMVPIYSGLDYANSKKENLLDLFSELKFEKAVPAIRSSLTAEPEQDIRKVSKALENITGIQNQYFDSFRRNSRKIDETAQKLIIDEWLEILK